MVGRRDLRKRDTASARTACRIVVVGYNAKAYQVRQVLDAIARLEAGKSEESDGDA